MSDEVIGLEVFLPMYCCTRETTFPVALKKINCLIVLTNLNTQSLSFRRYL